MILILFLSPLSKYLAYSKQTYSKPYRFCESPSPFNIKPQSSSGAVLFCMLAHLASPTHVPSQDNMNEKIDSPFLKVSQAPYFLSLLLTVQVEKNGSGNKLQLSRRIEAGIRQERRQEAKWSGQCFPGRKAELFLTAEKVLWEKRAVLFPIKCTICHMEQQESVAISCDHSLWI